MIRSIVSAAVLAGAATAPGIAFAQEFPSRPVRIISPYGPGGASDSGLRILGTRLTELGWPSVVIENRPGASGAIGAQAARR